MADAVTVRDARVSALGAIAEAARAVADGTELQPMLDAVTDAARVAAGADVAAIWLRERDALVATSVAAESSALAAELEGLRTPLGTRTADLLRERVTDDDDVATIALPLSVGAQTGSLELLRAGSPFDAGGERLAALAADLASAALRLSAGGATGAEAVLLDVGGDALAAVSEAEHAATRIARLATRVSGAEGALVWTVRDGDVALSGIDGVLGATPDLEQAVRAVIGNHHAAEVADDPRRGTLVTLQLGQPPLGALQLVFAPGNVGREPELDRLTTFAVRAAHALRATVRAEQLAHELERSRALLTVVGEATARLSLAHTLDIALDRLGDLFGTARLAVYLDSDSALATAAERGLEGPHEQVARALLDAVLGPRRGRDVLEIADVTDDAALAPAAEGARAAGIGAVIAVPLVVEEQPIGLLALYPVAPRTLTAHEAALLVALAAQLGVAVQNARLHEEATALGRELETVLESEREAARRLQTLYDISRSFAQSLSLETTLDVLAESIVTLLEVDAAIIRMPDERGLDFTARALHVNDRRVDAAARALLARPQPLSREQLRRLVASGEPLLVDARVAEELGGSLALLAPFLEKGSSAAVVPIVSSGDLLATLTIVSLHPGRPVAGEVVETAVSITGQAALAIDNARLYAQQKEFADTMQRSLLPRAAPELPGLELGDVYESSARVDVGGDVYDYLTLDDGRLAVVLGDVTGHGVDATADMAMAKFVFRSLAREHVDPGAFLAAANEVVASEIAPGKFITMVELVIDPVRGEVACAAGGHPQPRLVLPDGRVEGIAARGLALGIDAPQEYETVKVDFPPGACVVVYTDGVVEARREGELFGLARFDELLAEKRQLPAKEVALAALAACREWSDGDLTDDFAVVVIKRAD
ncbi:MAG TPA: SpoIIE family protein phosphatase [Gaiellaceae bacterium]|nr:SpoIIE family protein phosphatase [Gaiellaceae bacterium]